MRALTLVALTITACTTPCDALVARPHTCGTAPGPANAWNTCEALRENLSAHVFDTFAQCIDVSSCGDTNAVPRCTQSMALSAPPSPCMQLQLWGAACGLAPMGSVENCDAYADGPHAAAFACWVGCVTTGGCPHDGDARFNACGNPNTYLNCLTG